MLRISVLFISIFLLLASTVSAQTELVRNGGFSNGSDEWQFGNYGGNASGGVINGEYRILVYTAGSEHWHAQFTQTGLALQQGKTYEFSFDARKGDNNPGTQSMQVNIGQSNSPYTSYFGNQNQMVTLTQSMTRVSFTIVMDHPSDYNTRIEFNCGKSTGSFFLDNISLIEQPDNVAKLSATPVTIDFGTVIAGASCSAVVTLSNSGTASTTVNALQSNSQFFSADIVTPATVPAGGMVMMPVLFTPESQGAATGELTIYSSASDNPVITIGCTGEVYVPGLTVSCASIAQTAWPEVPVTASMELSNSSDVPVSWSISGNPSWLTVTPASGVIEAAATSTVSFEMVNTAVGVHTGSLALTHSATNVSSPIALPCTLEVKAPYIPTCPYIDNPEMAIDFVKECAAFRMLQRDNESGGFFTDIDRQGNSTGSEMKSLCGQSRIAYAFARAFMLTGDGNYLEYAHHALKFLYTHGWNNGWYFVTDREGNFIDHWGHDDWWSFQQHYALVGIMAMVEATGGNIEWNDGVETDHTWLMRGIDNNYTGLWDDNEGTKGYFDRASTDWTTRWNKGFHATVDGITTHALSLSMVYDSLNHRNRFLELADNAVDHLIGSMENAAAGFPEVFDSQWHIDNETPTMDIGHGYKTAWVLLRAYLLHPDHPEYRIAAKALMENLWEHGCYDSENGAPFRYLNWQTGEITSTDKDFWMVEQGFTSGMMSYYTLQEPALRDRYLKMADGSLNFFMEYMVDPVFGECFNIVSEDGSSIVDENKGGLFTAGYHSVELGYYAYLYSSLFYHKKPVELFYYYPPADNERSVVLTPLTIENEKLKILEVTLDGEPYYDFSADTRTVHLPSGTGGTLKVTFVNAPAVTYTVDASSGDGGTISPSGTLSVNEGASLEFTISADDGFIIGNVRVDDISVGTPERYTLAAVAADHTIVATFIEQPRYVISVGATVGGTVSPEGSTTVNAHESVTVTITPSSEYKTAEVLVDGEPVGPVTSYTFTDITANHSLVATFVPIPEYTVSVSSTAGGTAEPAGESSVKEHGTFTCTVSAATGYRIEEVLVDGEPEGPVTSWTFTDITSDHSVVVTFSPVPVVTIQASASDGGSISPSGAVDVSEGGTQTFTFEPDIGYEVATVLVDGESVAPEMAYTFTEVTADHEIQVGFSRIMYTVSASAGTGGTITPAGEVTVPHGESLLLTVAANSGYELSGLTVDGSAVDPVQSYTFSNVTSSHTIAASFSVVSSVVYQINCGSSNSAAPFSGDQFGNGGTMRTVADGITISGVTDPAPEQVYRSERYGNSTYTIPNLIPAAEYLIRLHFAELYWTSAGKRAFDVSINGITVLSDFDLYAETGARYKATVREFQTSANGAGQITIVFTTKTDNATIEGIEILEAVPNEKPTVTSAAAADPTLVTGIATVLSVLGDDDGGEENLTYTWSATGSSPATVVFSDNGTNNARNCTATFSTAGTYTLQAVITDQGNKSVSSSVEVTVVQTPSSMAITPDYVTVAVNAIQLFTASVRDQFGVLMNDPSPVSWTVSGGGVIGTDGMFTADASPGGPYTVVAAYNGLEAQASLEVKDLPSVVYRLNCGSYNGYDPFTGDQFGSGGTMRSVSNYVNTNGISDAAPQNVYHSERYGNSTYSIAGLNEGGVYTVRLHFAELYWTSGGKRRFDVEINGETVLADYDLFAETGARYKAMVHEFSVNADDNGQILIKFITIADNATIEGIEIIR